MSVPALATGRPAVQLATPNRKKMRPPCCLTVTPQRPRLNDGLTTLPNGNINREEKTKWGILWLWATHGIDEEDEDERGRRAVWV